MSAPVILPPVSLRQRLVEEAQRAREQAYAPYSGFAVGAAILAADGSIYRGANVENCAFGSTICAERHAVGSAVVAGARAFHAIALVVDFEWTITPCGACLQVLEEFTVPWAICHNLRDQSRIELALHALLPRAPNLAQLAKYDGYRKVE